MTVKKPEGHTFKTRPPNGSNQKPFAPQWVNMVGAATFKEQILPGETVFAAFERVAQAAAFRLSEMGIDGKLESDDIPLSYYLGQNFYEALEKGWLSPATPVLANMGTDRAFPISCFGIDVDDSLWDIGQKRVEMEMLTQKGGGVGVGMNRLRPKFAPVSSGGHSNGVIPWIKTYDSAIIATSQAGVRRGSCSININVRHKDLIDFLKVRIPEGDVNRQSLNVNHCVQITNEFMQSCIDGNKEDREILEQIYNMRFKSGQPYIQFIDTTNARSPMAYKINKLETSMTNICCLAGDTLVATSTGPRRIDQINEEVKIFDGVNWVKNSSFNYWGQDTLLEIELAGGLVLKANPKHRWFVSKNYNEIKREKLTELTTSQLSVGDYLEYHEKETHGSSTLKGAYVLGFLVGDGTSYRGKPLLHLYNTKYSCEERLISSLSEIQVDTDLRSDCITLPSFGEEKVHTHALHYGICARKAMKGLTARKSILPFASSYKYSFPNEWVSWNRDSKIQFVAGLMDADGCCIETGLQLVSVSSDFLFGLQELLASMAVTSTVKAVGDRYRIIVSMTDSYKLMKEMNCQRLQDTVREPVQGKMSTWRRIDKITELPGKHSVYCPRVETTGKFALANGIMTGNTEITLYTDKDHSFVCCLSSLNLAKYDEWKDYTFSSGLTMVELMTYFLEGVIEEFIVRSENYPGFENSRRSAVKGRAIGIGVLGWHTFLQEKNLPFASMMSTSYTNSIFKKIRDESEKASKNLAERFGEPEWCKGTGLRHTHRMAIAPTVSNAKRANASDGIEPLAANYYMYNGAQGSFVIKNQQLEKVLETYNKNDEGTWRSIANSEGSVQHLDFMNAEHKEVFLTFREISQLEVVRQAGMRQAYIDQAQSLNLAFPADVPEEYFHKVHMEAWKVGLKTLYYCRSKGVLKGDVATRVSSMIDKELKDTADCAWCEG